MKGIYDYFKEQGYNPTDPEFYRLLDVWESYYKGDVCNFHSYNQYNGIKMIKRRRKSLHMAKKICEDKADLIFNEKVMINLADKETKSFIDNVLEENDFYSIANRLVEKSNALGTGAFVEIFDGNNIIIDTVGAKNIVPLNTDGDKIIECAFVSEKFFKGEKHIYINMHLLENREYVIKNTVLKYDKGRLNEVPIPAEAGILPYFKTGSPKPFFQIIRPNTVNNTGFATPMGISAFSGCMDILQGIDIIYDSFINEFELGKKRIFIDSSLAQVSIGENGASLSPVFDTSDVCFYGLSGLREKGEFIKEVNMDIRAAEHIDAINMNLALLSSKSGLGRRFYAFDKSGLKTATEVISENSDLYRKIKKDEIPVSKALKDLVKIVIFIGNTFFMGQFTHKGLSVYFDDAVIEDSSSLKNAALLERNSGIISDEQYFKETRNMDYECAKAFAEKMKGGTK